MNQKCQHSVFMEELQVELKSITLYSALYHDFIRDLLSRLSR